MLSVFFNSIQVIFWRLVTAGKYAGMRLAFKHILRSRSKEPEGLISLDKLLELI